jgi:hypothetical protein
LNDVAPAVAAGVGQEGAGQVLLADATMTACDGRLQIESLVGWSGPPVVLEHAVLAGVLSERRQDRLCRVTFADDGTRIVLEAGGESFALESGRDPGRFPKWEAVNVRPLCRLPCDQFCRAVRMAALHAIGRRHPVDDRLILIEVRDDQCMFLSSDEGRVACVRVEHDQAVDDSRVLVPAKTLAAAAEVAFQYAEDAVQLEAGPGDFVAALPGTVVSARLVHGDPSLALLVHDASISALLVEGTLSQSLAHEETVKAVKVTVPREGLVEVFQAAVAAIGRQTRAIECRVSGADVTVQAPGGRGQRVAGIAGMGSRPGPVSVRLDVGRALGWLRCLTSEDDPDVSVEVVDPASPAVLRCGEEYTVVLMTELATEGGSDVRAAGGQRRQADHGRSGVFPVVERPGQADQRHRGPLRGIDDDGLCDGQAVRPWTARAGAESRTRGAVSDTRRDRGPHRGDSGRVDRRGT